ncbi:hypothetical protein ACOSQ2_017295 [Xanthoceras sorbifolium]
MRALGAAARASHEAARARAPKGCAYARGPQRLVAILDGRPQEDLFDKLGFVLSTPKPLAPTDESTEEQRGEYEQWETLDEMAKFYIMATMSDVLQQQHEGMRTAAKIMLSLEEMFAMRSRTTKREEVIAFMNLRMKPGQAVKDHMMKVIAHLNIVELNGVEVDGEMKIYMIVNSLLDSFDQFKLDYTLNNKEYTLQGLMQDVQSTEKILVKSKG